MNNFASIIFIDMTMFMYVELLHMYTHIHDIVKYRKIRKHL